MKPPIKLPENYNYVAAFITLRCNLACPYCINRQGEFIPRIEMGAQEWFDGLSRIETREDLPITLQGGEPTTHKEFYQLVNMLHAAGKHLDLLTNGQFDVYDFMAKVGTSVFKRQAPYASIRFSFHMGMNPNELAKKVYTLKQKDYSVGIWALNHPDMICENSEMRAICEEVDIDFRMKEYLDDTHGTYKYPDAITGHKNFNVLCHPSELLIAPDGLIHGCHSLLYAGCESLLHINDELISFDEARLCEYYGTCNPCDVKIKTNRLQQGGHTSVKIERLNKHA